MPWKLPDELRTTPEQRFEEVEEKVERLEKVILQLFHSPRDAPLYGALNVLPELNSLVIELEREHGLRR